MRFSNGAKGLVILPALLSHPAALAAAELTGTARDALQRPLEAVDIRLENAQGKALSNTRTDKDGRFVFTGIDPGNYALVGIKSGFDQATALVLLTAKGAATDLVLPTNAALDLQLAAQKLDAARIGIEPRIGATTYSLTGQAIDDQPGGSDIPFNQTLLQAPDISQDSFGQIHLRNDHANIQYRIDGVILPEGISFFGQSLSSRFAGSVDLITGSLPAQYGLVTTGIVDITTKSGLYQPGGSVGFTGGSHGWSEPSIDYAGSAGSVNYYLSGDLLANGIGIENPTSSRTPIHDWTRQDHGFAYFEDILDSSDKIAAFFGGYRGDFQIPGNPGQSPVYQYGSQTSFDSSQLNENQTETNDYAALTFLRSTEYQDFQLSAFLRVSGLDYRPDSIGDLMFYGLAQDATRSDGAYGMQADATWRAADGHTIRYGGVVSAERATASTSSLVFPCVDSACDSVGTTPLQLSDKSGITGWTGGGYLQDEWKLTPKLTLNYGARFDWLDAYTQASQLSPRINAVWTPAAGTTLHAGYSRYFTPPSLELISGEEIAKFAGTTGYPNGYSPASPPQDGPILPERSNYFDIGAEHLFGSGLKLGVDGFYKRAHDLIDEGQFGAPIILSVFNYARADVIGGELTGSFKQGNWSSYGNLAVGREKARDIVSQQFNFTPDTLAYIANNSIFTDHSQWVTASGGIAYDWRGTRFCGDLLYGSGLRQDAGDIPNGGTVTPYTQVNLGVTHRFEDAPAGPLEIGLDVVNAFDRVYQIRSGNGVGVFAPQFGPRRAIYASVRSFF